MLQVLFKKHNSFLRPLKKKGFKEERVATMGLYDLGKSHDPGIQQEPPGDGRGSVLGSESEQSTGFLVHHGEKSRRLFHRAFRLHNRAMSGRRLSLTNWFGRCRRISNQFAALRRTGEAQCAGNAV